MNPLVVGPLIDILSKGLDRIFPDKAEAAQAQLKLIELQQNGQLAELNHELSKLNIDKELALGQVSINQVEASSDNIFKSGWRPFIGWVCGAGLLYEFILRPFIPLLCSLFLVQCPEMISLNEVLWELMFGMLGLGTLRTLDKSRQTY